MAMRFLLTPEIPVLSFAHVRLRLIHKSQS
jgi:hypothetical protein